MSTFAYYLIIINIIGFFLFLINTLLYANNYEHTVDRLLTIVSLMGGSVGILLSMLIFDRRIVKANMMSRVFIACVFVIQVIILLVIKGHFTDDFTLSFWTFFTNHKSLIVYLVIINFIAFAAFAVDKIAAIEDRSRIRNVTLLGLAFIGGSLGALFAMYLFNHKTLKDYYTVGVPLIIIMQVIVLFYTMNASW